MAEQSIERLRESVGEGWWPIVNGLHADIEKIAPGHRIEQVKEKFGGLRYYIDWSRVPEDRMADVQGLIVEAEARSAKTCEHCGKPASTRESHGWLVTLCDQHFQEREDRRAQEWSSPEQ